jgi:hypothetical protein
MSKDLGDEFLFYDSDGERIHVLNGTARHIFVLCDGKNSIDDMVHILVAEYEIDEETARHDTIEVLELLTGLGALDGFRSEVDAV